MNSKSIKVVVVILGLLVGGALGQQLFSDTLQNETTQLKTQLDAQAREIRVLKAKLKQLEQSLPCERKADSSLNPSTN
ncbi:hypothetical protein GCM10007895_00110 [Paraferrimonas sedimenticola]|uniref:Uncharacterized protein n=1 Tax=Paraferrimonas sedimenticola TaxID=375674 RepID=A0AA37VWB1_9GAMM|nr:hypothetical protein GCM10007895_00110 [Paraferrimonas sedimenticola]